MNAIQGENLQLIINETASSIKNSTLDDIARIIDEDTLRLGNEGNRARFTNFLVTLFDSEQSNERIKSELIHYFVAVDLAYRSKIRQLFNSKKTRAVSHSPENDITFGKTDARYLKQELSNMKSPESFKALQPERAILALPKNNLNLKSFLNLLNDNNSP